MEDKGTALRGLARTLERICAKHARLESEPRSFGPGTRLPPGLVHALEAVGRGEGLNIRDLAARFSTTASAASQMAARLVRQGLAEKRAAPHSNKEVRLFLTDKGWEVFRAHERLHAEHMDDLAARLGAFRADDMAKAKAVLEAVEKALDNRLEDPEGRWAVE